MRALRWIVGASLALALGAGTFVAVRSAGAYVEPGPLAGLWEGKGTWKESSLDKGTPGDHGTYTAELELYQEGTLISGTLTVTVGEEVISLRMSGHAGTGRLWLVYADEGSGEVFVLKGTIKGKEPHLVLVLDGDQVFPDALSVVKGTLKKVEPVK